MDKLNIFKSNLQNFKHLAKYSNNTRQHTFHAKFLQPGMKNVEFKHSWANMAHMHDLRVWTLAYAPSKKNNLQRL